MKSTIRREAARSMAKRGKSPTGDVKVFEHKEATVLMRPDVGTQAQFKKKKGPATYRYDSSLSPSLEWDRGSARERGEQLLARLAEAQARVISFATDTAEDSRRQLRRSLEEAQDAVAELKSMSGPFLNWSGKAERLSFDVPTLPLFVHERLSTKAIIQTLKGHKRDKQEPLFDPVSMETRHQAGDDVPAWFLDTDYNGLSFHASQAFFPRTEAWENLRKALKGEFEDSVWEHLAGAVSAPFELGEQRRIAVKVIDDRGNELMVERKLH